MLPLPFHHFWPATWYLEVLQGQRRGLGAALLRGVAAGLAPFYGAGVTLNRRLYDWGWLQPRHLPRAVISVGNLTLGGTGKTPCVLWLARRLQATGRRVAVLLRGHGRRGRTMWQVVSDGVHLHGGPTEVGDEPYLLARKLPGAAVVVGKRREVTGRWAIEEWGAEVLLLDDGLQYWRLARDREIVLLDVLSPLGVPRLFPAGTLREPIRHLRYAHEFWLTRTESAAPQATDRLERWLRACFPNRPVYRSQQRPVALHPWPAGVPASPSTLQGCPVATFCGIGQPLSFAHTLTRLAPARLWAAFFPDHHPYQAEELIALAEAARSAGAALLVTTEKDSVRLPPVELPLPLWVLEVELTFAEEPPVILDPSRLCGQPS